MPEDYGDRTEQPTERRRDEARRKGNVARSTDLNAAISMLAAAVALWWFGEPLARSLGELLAGSLRVPETLQLTAPDVTARFRALAGFLAAAVLPVMMFLFAAALAVNLGQVGFLITPEALQPKLGRINPVEGAKRILSIRAVVRLLASLAKLCVVVAIAVWVVASLLPDLSALTNAQWDTLTSDSAESFREQAAAAAIFRGTREAAVALAFWLALALFVLALADFGFQRWKHDQDLRMTKQEVRDEVKTMEGDPHIRQRRREAHRKLAEARQLAHVPEADVVVTNPTHVSVALQYNPATHAAPVVVAKGMGEIALRIRQIAVEHRIPLVERPDLARTLYRRVNVGREAPVDLYEALVEIMAYVYRITGRTPPGLRES